MNKVLVCILNYNLDDKAREMAAKLNTHTICDTVIVDSSGLDKGFVKSGKPFYTGNFNRASDLFLRSDADYCLYVCSDIEGDIVKVVRHLTHIPDNVGVYSPMITGRANKYWYSFGQGIGLRDSPAVEGMCIAASRAIIREIDPITDNIYGWGLDSYKCYIAKQMGLRVVIDNDVVLYHPKEVAYDAGKAVADGQWFAAGRGAGYQKFLRSIRYPFLLRVIYKGVNLLRGKGFKL